MVPLGSDGLQFVPTAEGYYDFPKSRYIYQYKDHLGNVRLSYYKSGGAKVVERATDYYPFGMEHPEGYTDGDANQNYNYKFGGKELQETGMYDYGARFYMPDIGRWGVTDPLAETSRCWSVYTYAYNNPIRFIDPDGRQGNDVIITGSDKDKAFELLKASVEKQLTLSMDVKGKVTATRIEGAEQTDASNVLFHAANVDKDHIVTLHTDSDMRIDQAEGTDYPFFEGGAYRGSYEHNGKVYATNVVNPDVLGKYESAMGATKGTNILHEALEGYVGSLLSPGSPAAISPQTAAMGYNDAHDLAAWIDPRYKESSGFSMNRTTSTTYNGGTITISDNVSLNNKKTGVVIPIGNYSGTYKNLKKK